MTFEKIYGDLSSIENIKTKDIDLYNKRLIRENSDVSDLKSHVLSCQLVHRTYFQVSLGKLKSLDEQLDFIENNAELLQDWWHVDQLTQFVRKHINFDCAYSRAVKHIESPLTFLRRWGYVIFLTGLQKDIEHTDKILGLIKDDDEYYVQMAEAWLIADLAVFNIEAVRAFMESTDIKYNIAGKAIQKMCDSFRISDKDKEYMKSLRKRWKDNEG